MFAWDIAFWYCCLNPREQGVLRGSIIGLTDTLWVGLPVEIWDAFWLPYGGVNASVKEAFLSIYRLEIVTITVEEIDISVVRPRDGYLPAWISWSLFLLTPEAACIGGCRQSRVP